MSSHKNHTHLERIKEGLHTTNLSESEKSESMKHIDEWILEDKAEGLLYAKLLKISQGIKPLLAELGLI